METSAVISSSFAMDLKRRRIILPDLVLGKLSPKRISSGLAIGPISLLTHSLRAKTTSLILLLSGLFDFKTTNATIDSPLISCGRPTTAASAT